MQQYLINASAIWLLSLLVFDLLLRREKYHSYNRFYLLFTLLLGILLPLVQWQSSAAVYPEILKGTANRFIVARQAIADTTSQTEVFDWTRWLIIAYTTGALSATAFLFIDVLKLVRFFRTGKRSSSAGWQVIETGKGHSPFSFRSTLFVHSASHYGADEWNMILAHELQHSIRLHIADLALTHLARIVFWFHPLVYVYQRRLLLVHEYQADTAAATEPQPYGRFLIEQSVLHAAPSITHSFNRSPIKKRIVMLTRKSNASSKTKLLVIIPLMAVSVGCFTKSTTDNQFLKDGNTVTYKGNKFELSEATRDTITIMDPMTGQEFTKVREMAPALLTMNGKKIYQANEASQPEYIAGNGTLEEIVIKYAASNMSSFPDGNYYLDLSDVVIDETGKIVFYDFTGIERKGHNNPIGQDSVKPIREFVEKTFSEAPLLKPGKINGQNVIVKLNTDFYKTTIHVSGHKATYTTVS